MKVCLAYILPQAQRATYEPLAYRFAQSYMANPPGAEPHEIHVVGNGGPVTERQKKLFDPLPCQWWEHDNSGKDIGAYQMIAEKLTCDLLLCFGSHVHFWKAGWLDRIVEAFLENGPGVFGFWGFHQPADHLRTTAFVISPDVLRAYPRWVGNGDRYAFEHSPKDSIAAFARQSGFPALQVTWTEALDRDHWRHLVKHEMILLDQFCDKQGIK